MSKTYATLYLETNKKRGLPQENAFLHNIYRLPHEFGTPYQRTASSDSPIQICALLSAQGEDTSSAMALQSVLQILQRHTSEAQNRSYLDFDQFLPRFIEEANQAVCTYSLRAGSTPVRVSLTILFVDGDTLRIASIGNTRAVLVRQGNCIPLTEDQTIAHRYVQMGAILPAAEATHPERGVLTQYIGRFTQDGPVVPEKNVFMKLRPGDEIYLIGTGISACLPDEERNSILLAPIQIEQKTNELISRCQNRRVVGGLSALGFRVDSTYIMPSNAPQSSFESTLQTTDTTANEDPNLRTLPKNSGMAKKIILPVGIFLGCLLVGYLGMWMLFNVGDLMTATTTTTDVSTAPLTKVMYVTSDMVGLYPDASLNGTPSVYLTRGDVVTLNESLGSFSRITTTDGATGYVLTTMLSENDPTIGESLPEMSADPTPIPSQEQTAVTTAPSSTVTDTTTTTQPSQTTATPTPTETSASAPVTSTPTNTPSPSASTNTPSPSPTATTSAPVTGVPSSGAEVSPGAESVG